MKQIVENYPIIHEKKVTWSEVTSSDEDEEQGLKIPQSPNIILTDDIRNKRFICGLLLLIVYVLYLLFLVLLIFHGNDEGSESITASLNSFHHNHRIYRCNDRGFDCCYLYTEQHNYQFNPRYMVGKDEGGSNCPSLEDIVNRYNDYLEYYEMNANCTEVQCCHLDNKQENKVRNHHDENEILEITMELKVINGISTCPSIPRLMYMETHGYPNPDRDLYIIMGFFMLLCCWGLSDV